MLGRRLALTIPTLFGVLVVTFLLLNVIPGDPVQEMVGERADSATIARLRAELRLDDPLPVQFGHYLWGVVRGDLGRSYITRRPIARDLAERFPKTAQLALTAMLFAALSGITLGVLAAVRPGGLVDRFAMLLSYLGVSFPVYWVGMLLILLFAVALGWLPASGSGGAGVPRASRAHAGDAVGRVPGAHDAGRDAGRAVERLHPDGAGQRAVRAGGGRPPRVPQCADPRDHGAGARRGELPDGEQA